MPLMTKSSFRVLWKDKAYTLLNAAGLAMALATCFVIYTWVQYERGFDRSAPSADRVYRVTTGNRENDERIASTYPMVRARVLAQFPEIETSARIFSQGLLGSQVKAQYLDRSVTDFRFYYADSTALTLFGLGGTLSHALARPATAVITKPAAERIFGGDEPLGKSISIDGRDFEITAVVESLPSQSHFHFDIMATMLSHPWIRAAEDNVWSGVVFHTYVRLKSGADPRLLESKIASFMANFPNDPERYAQQVTLRLQPLTDIHLHSNMRFELEPNGSATYVYLFISIGVMVMLVAVFNYINLTTARHTQRFKEIATRKVMGASTNQLLIQFLSESMLLVSGAVALAAVAVWSVSPQVASVTGIQDFGSLLVKPTVLLMAALFIIVLVFATGAVPALMISSQKPLLLLRGNAGPGSGKSLLRQILVVFQFTIAITLTVCASVVYLQVNFIRDANLGYRRDHIVVLNIGFDELTKNYRTLKSEMLRVPGVFGVAASSQVPVDIQTAENIDVGETSVGVQSVSVDPDFFDVMGIQLAAGQQIVKSLLPNDTVNHFVLTPQVLDQFGWNEETAMQQSIRIRHGNMQPGKVVGVASGFHFQSLHHELAPLVLEFNPSMYQYLLVKLNTQNVATTLGSLEKIWKPLAGGVPFQYSFLDDYYDRLYRTEQQSNKLFTAFSTMAGVISLLGLFGLTSFAVERRTKEIGIRRVLGAHIGGLLSTVSGGFVLLMAAAFVIATPLGYYFMKSWLSGFAYRVDIGWSVFALAGVVNILLGVLVISTQAFRIAKMNPVEVLRSE